MRTLNLSTRAQRHAARLIDAVKEGAACCALSLLRLYKRWVSPCLPSACRFHPTCSEYAMQAIEKHGLWRGSRMGIARLLRCHPFHEGGFDPVR